MRSIFISGSSSERLQIAEYCAVLRAAGWIITYDWTRNRGWEDPEHDEAKRAHLYCLRGIREAWVVWYVAPEQKSEGSHAELGIAATMRRRIVASGRALGSLGRVFHRLADLSFPTHGEALQFLVASSDGVGCIAPAPRERLLLALPRIN